MRQISTAVMAILMFGAANIALSADDPSIQGEPREKSQKAMQTHIEQNQINGDYVVYDGIQGELLLLEPVKLHEGLVKKGEYYISCADFVDADGNKYDLDFLVAEQDGEYKVYDAIVHKKDGDKRKYHVHD